MVQLYIVIKPFQEFREIKSAYCPQCIRHRENDGSYCPEFIPYFNGTDAGDVHTPGVGNYDGTAGYPKWGSYYSITNNTNAPGTRNWSDVQNLDMRLQTDRPNTGRLDVYKVEIRVT